MTINKAINTLSAMQEDYEGDEFPDEEDALKLGIEALNQIQWLRSREYFGYDSSLPSETKE